MQQSGGQGVDSLNKTSGLIGGKTNRLIIILVLDLRVNTNSNPYFPMGASIYQGKPLFRYPAYNFLVHVYGVFVSYQTQRDLLPMNDPERLAETLLFFS